MKFNLIQTGLIISLLTIFIISCSDRTVNPFEENAGFFSIYGAIDADSELNYIRVKNTQIPALPDSLNPLDANIQFQNLASGSTISLRDTLINFSGFTTHNLIIDQLLDPRKTYVLSVEGTDGRSVSTKVTIPDNTEVEVNLNEVRSCREQIEFTYKNVVEPENVRMEVGFFWDGEIRWSEIGLVAKLERRQEVDEMFVSMSLNNLLVEVFPPRQLAFAPNPRSVEPSVNCQSIRRIFIRYRHLGEEWVIFQSRPGRFPSDPLEWQDVEDGLGFLGAFRKGEFIIPVNF